jgi:hypothetical protein
MYYCDQSGAQLGSVGQQGKHVPRGTNTMLAGSVSLAAAERAADAAVLLVRLLDAPYAFPRQRYGRDE